MVALLPVFAQSPITPEQVETYLETVGWEDLVQDIIDLQSIEEAVPVVGIPDPVILIVGNDVHVTWPGPITIEIAGRLSYRITIPPYKAENMVPGPRNRTIDVLISSGIASVVGIITYAILPVDSEFARGIIGVAAGAGAGILSYLIIGIF
jgi:hypothetical protein